MRISQSCGCSHVTDTGEVTYYPLGFTALNNDCTKKTTCNTSRGNINVTDHTCPEATQCHQGQCIQPPPSNSTGVLNDVAVGWLPQLGCQQYLNQTYFDYLYRSKHPSYIGQSMYPQDALCPTCNFIFMGCRHESQEYYRVGGFVQNPINQTSSTTKGYETNGLFLHNYISRHSFGISPTEDVSLSGNHGDQLNLEDNDRMSWNPDCSVTSNEPGIRCGNVTNIMGSTTWRKEMWICP